MVRPTAPVTRGQVLADKYRVERVIGAGGMGVVVEATQLDLDRRVALKFLTNDGSRDMGTALGRFEREARAAAKLRTDHVARVYEMGRLPNGEPYIVMELLEGRNLASLLSEHGPLDVDDAVAYTLQVCEGIAEAHASGIVHRDLKPENLFLTERPDGSAFIKILDFGISKLTDDAGRSFTQTAGVVGSPLYMSPEQLESSKHVNQQTDVWSLGAILYELLTGVAPFEAATVPKIHVKILTCDPEPPSTHRRGVLPDGLDDVILRALRRSPEQRYVTSADLAVALEPFAPRGARFHVSAAVRIIQGSKLKHGALPEAPDSIRVPPIMTPPERVRESITQRTSVSGDETQADPASLPTEAAPSDASGDAGARTGADAPGATIPLDKHGSRRVAPMVALAAVAVVGAVALVSRTDERSASGGAESPAPSTVSAPPTAPPEPVAVPSVSPPADEGAGGAVGSPQAGTTEAATTARPEETPEPATTPLPVAKPRSTATKTRPTTRAVKKPSKQDLLQYRR